MPLLAALLAVSLAAAPSSTTSGPTLAVEDTMRTEVPEVLVKAPRVTLDEILDRVARGEARRDSLLHDIAFTATMRVVRVGGASKDPELLIELVSRVYKQKPGKLRDIELRRWHSSKIKHSDAQMSFTPGMAEGVVTFAFRPEARRAFHYRIVGRDLLGDHLIYRIAFEPKSLIGEPEPGGLVWVDTRDFVIVRQELDFSRSPAPLILKGVDRAVIERQQVDGHWVLSRLLMRVTMSVPIPKFGRVVDMAVRFDDYRVNRGIADSLFTPGAGR